MGKKSALKVVTSQQENSSKCEIFDKWKTLSLLHKISNFFPNFEILWGGDKVDRGFQNEKKKISL